MDHQYQLTPTSSTLDQQLEFAAISVRVNNPTNQWIFLDALSIYVPPYQVGAIYPLPATTRAKASFSTPPLGNIAAPATIAGQVATLGFYDLALPPQAGQAALGGRASYEDRNPLSIVGSYTNYLAPHGVTTRAAYTVPAGRRAKIQSVRLTTESGGGYNAGQQFIETRVTAYPGGFNGQIIADAYLWQTNSAGTRNEDSRTPDFFLVASDILTIETDDLGVGGNSYHFAFVHILEFDQ